MTWGPDLTPEEYQAIEQRQQSVAVESASLQNLIDRLNELEKTQEIQRDADKKMYDYFNVIAWSYEAEYRQYVGYYYDGDLILDADLEATAKNEYDTKLFPDDWTDPFAPKTSIAALNIVPDNADTFDLQSEIALSDVAQYGMQAIRSDKVDDTEPGSAETTTAVTSSSTSVTVDDVSPFQIGKWAALSKVGEITVESGSDGQCQDPGGSENNKFRSDSAEFTTNGVVSTDKLIITGGANAGEYTVSSIESETILYIVGEFPSVSTTNEVYDITRTTGNKRAIVEVTDINDPVLDITVIVMSGDRVGSGAFISSQLSDFKNMVTIMMRQLQTSLDIQVDSLENNEDNVSSPSAATEIANALLYATDTHTAYTSWIQAGGVVTESGTDGQCVDPGAGADDRFTSVSALFQTVGVQPGDRLDITGSSNAGSYSILTVESETSLRINVQFPSVPSTGETYEVRFGTQWEDGVLESVEILLANRIANSTSRKAEIERAVSPANSIYDRRAVWINALVNRAFGSWTTLENTRASIELLESQKEDIDEIDDAYKEFLGQ